MTRRIFPRIRIRLAALLALLLPLCVALAEPRVRGTLSTNTAGVGEAVEFEIRVEDGSPDGRPGIPRIEGLEIREAGSSSGFSGSSTGGFSHYASYSFVVVPKREGKFTIPAIELRVGNRVVKTLPATLTVAPGEAAQEAGDLAFAKISLPKRSLYVGEVAPLEIRLYLSNEARWDLRSSPALNGDGFSIQPLGKPAQRDVEIGGKRYILVAFSTVLTPAKAGKLSVGPVPVTLAVSKPSRNRQRLGPFAMLSMEPAQEMSVTAPALEIQVKPLPVEGRPDGFSGAIGKFEFAATGTPDRVKIGEPVSMTLTVKGSGNFDRIGQPPLAEPEGWTTYSAKQKFDDGGNAGTEGVKTFDLPVTPTAKKTAMPVFAFSFFDPEAAKYVTLKSAAAPLNVEGEPLAAVRPAPAEVSRPEPPKTEPKPPAVQDILANLPDIGVASAAFGPSLSPAVLFSMMFAPVPALFALLVWRRRRSDGRAARMAALRRERAGLLSQVKGAPNRAEVLDAAVKAMRLHAQLENGGAQPDDDADAMLGSRKLDADTAKALREIFDARTELLYAGAARESDSISSHERDRVLEALTAFERSPRK
jgi:hypothetical protein